MDKKILPEKYMCLMCGYIYKPERGDAKGGLAPGTLLSDAPEDWVCPKCGGAQRNFARKEDD